MKRKTLALFSSILLCSCAGKPTETGINFVEQRKACSTIPEFSSDLVRQLTDKCEKKLFQEKTTIYSPIGSELIRQYKENDEGFKELYSLMNVESEHFLLKDTFATAATEGNVDTGKFKDMVKTFEGTISELNTSIKDYFKIDFDTVIDSGLYHYSYFELKDCFTEEKETVQGKEFNHEGSHTYVSFYEQGSYYENEDYAIAEVKLSETTFRILQAKEGRTVDSDTIFQTPSSEESSMSKFRNSIFLPIPRLFYNPVTLKGRLTAFVSIRKESMELPSLIPDRLPQRARQTNRTLNFPSTNPSPLLPL